MPEWMKVKDFSIEESKEEEEEEENSMAHKLMENKHEAPPRREEEEVVITQNQEEIPELSVRDSQLLKHLEAINEDDLRKMREEAEKDAYIARQIQENEDKREEEELKRRRKELEEEEMQNYLCKICLE